MRALLLIFAGSALGICVARTGAAQEVPADPPPEAPKAPEAPAPPPPEPAPPPPPPSEPAPTAPAPTPPPPESPPPPPPPPPPKSPPPAPITLEETPEAPPPATAPAPEPRAAAPRRTTPPPAPVTEQRPPEPAPVATPPPSDERAPESTEAEGEEDAEKKDKEDEDDSGGLLGPFRIGGLVGLGLPSVLSFGGMIKITRFFGAGLNVGLIPTISLSLYGEAQLSYQEYDIYGRLFPFGSAVFVGAGVGYASVKGRFTNSYDISALQTMVPELAGFPNPLTVTSEGSVRTLVLIPAIGLLQTFGIGFTIGIDVGAQIPIAPSETHFETPMPPSTPQVIIDQFVTPNDARVQDTLDTIARSVVPTLNVRVGWLF